MSTGEAMDDATNECLAARLGAREALLLAVLLYAMARSAEVLAADQPANVLRDMQPIAGGKPVPRAFMANLPTGDFEAATGDFRPRKITGMAALPATQFDASMQPSSLAVTPPWQRLADYRVLGRVQLLTLWQSPHNTVSLQAGKHGGPSLQWSSHVVNRGSAPRGVFDRFVASSLGAAGLHARVAARGAEAAPAIKPLGATAPAN
jgi:hypothetical protein